MNLFFPTLFKSITSPKSPSLQTPSWEIKILSGFMSMWTRFLSCKCRTACRRSINMRQITDSGMLWWFSAYELRLSEN